MNNLGLVPDVIDKLPADIIEVTYDGKLKVDQGNELTPTQVKNNPDVKYNGNAQDFYALCMTDLDVPSRKEPMFREWHHWLVGNIAGNDIKSGETLSEYVGSGPPQGTGFLGTKPSNGTCKIILHSNSIGTCTAMSTLPRDKIDFFITHDIICDLGEDSLLRFVV